MRPKPVLLLILDGFGYSTSRQHNAIALADTPNWDKLWQAAPHTLLECSGAAVGLPDDQMGNSEVGHLHLGAGRLLPQDYTRINQAIDDGSFFSNPVLLAAIEKARGNGGALHVLGLVSPGGVHSHEQHLLAMLKMAVDQGLKQIYVHAFLDGRDTPPRSALQSIVQLEDRIKLLGAGRIASVIGRYFAMDRDNRWDRVEKAWKLIAKGQGDYVADDAVSAVSAAYARGENDEFVAATVIKSQDDGPVEIHTNDTVVFMNFRSDRAREISKALCDHHFSAFTRDGWVKPGCFITLTEYDETFSFPVAFPPISLRHGLGEQVADAGMRQLRLAETEKYAHVTFFFNGGIETPFPGEDRLLVPSPRIATYDLQPEMSAPEVTRQLVKAISEQQYDLIVCNYANGDMVGHTGIESAAVEAVEALDVALGAILNALDAVGGAMLLTADHGNAEQMVDEMTGEAHTAHTINPVPLVLYGVNRTLASDGSLKDIAPTLLELLQLTQPHEMTGHSLLR